MSTVQINLKGKIAFIAGVADDQGYGFAIAKALAEAGATIIIGTWPPVYEIFKRSLEMGKLDESLKMKDGSLLKIAKIYPLDALFDTPSDIPSDISENKRYKELSGYTISEVADAVEKDFGHIDILVHSLANAPEIKSPLLATSRKGYLAALSSSSYSFVSLCSHFAKIMPSKSAALTLSYLAAEKTIPGYGGGMSSAKAALESDVKTLAFELGKKNIRINAISAGPLRSRAARAIGFIDAMIAYSEANAPLQGKEISAEEIGHCALFLLSSLASALTGQVIYVDNGLSSMGIAQDSKSLMEIHSIMSH